MEQFLIIIGVLLIITALVLLVSYVCFYIVFYVPDSKKKSKEEYPIPKGSVYEPHREQMISWIKEARNLPQEDVSITSYDGLILRGKYYEYAPGAPIELMMHGYRGEAERDMGGGVQRCFALKRSALIIDQRACGNSDGNIITFGIKEHRDCLSWVDFMVEHFGPDVKIILTGISMGASTVLMAAGKPLPQNVIGVLADCGFTSAKEIILKVAKQIHLPGPLLYPFIKLGAKLYGGFDLDEYSPTSALEKCHLPVILFHGESDDFVPCDMSHANYEKCKSVKKIITVPGAGHGLSYIIDPQKYLEALKEFFEPMFNQELESYKTIE